MSELKNDPLLGIARALIGFTIALLGVVSATMTICIVSALTFHREFLTAELARQGVPEPGLTMVVLLIALILVLCIMGIIFLRHLYRMVQSVKLGDPFNPVNADRLRAMGWLTLIAQPIFWLIRVAAHWFEKFDVNVSLNLSGFLFAITLFILARVFRTGAAMREELEGTV